MSAVAPPSLTAVGLVEEITGGTLDPVALVRQTLDRIYHLDPAVNAFTELLGDSALEAAAGTRGRLDSGDLLPLAGLPVAVKDHVWVAGATSTMATASLAGFRPDVDSRAVARLRRAGALIVGKTANPEYCLPATCSSRMYGVTRNPWALDRCPGASSGGSAAAVAAGMVPVAIGTDALGSIRIPAAYCGTVGFKPSNGSVPIGPGFPEMGTLNTVGPLTMSVADAALVHRVMSGGRHLARTPLEASRLRVGWAVDFGRGGVSDDVREALLESLQRLETAGFELVEVRPPAPDRELAWDLVTAEMTPAPSDLGSIDDAGVRSMFERATRVSASDYLGWDRRRREYREVWEQMFDTIDVLVTPTLGTAAFGAAAHGAQSVNGVRFDVDQDPWWELVAPANLVGGPALAVPMGVDGDGLPLSLQVQASPGADALCLGVGEVVEATLGRAQVAHVTPS